MAASTPIDASFHKLLRSIQAQAPAATRMAASTPGVAGHLSGSCPAAAGELPGCCPSSPRQLPVSYRAASGKLGSCRAAAGHTPNRPPACPRQLPGNCQATARQLPDPATWSPELFVGAVARAARPDAHFPMTEKIIIGLQSTLSMHFPWDSTSNASFVLQSTWDSCALLWDFNAFQWDSSPLGPGIHFSCVLPVGFLACLN